MSYITLDSIRWGGVPQIGVSFGYESQRSGSSMQYRIWVTIDPLTGASYFGYPIYLSVYVDGSGVTAELLAAHGISVYGESCIDELLDVLENNT